MSVDLQAIAAGIEAGTPTPVRQGVEDGLHAGIAPSRLLQDGLLAGMRAVGDRFRDREIFLPEVLLAARALYAGLDVLKPHLAAGEAGSRGRVVLGTVQGDVHDIGKNLVGILLQGAGFEVIDLGKDVPAARFVSAAEDAGAGVIGVSALLTTTMMHMRDVVDAVRSRGLAGRVRVIVGGAPTSAAFAREIGADAWAYDAASAVEQVAALTSTPGVPA
jgi:5-methyltetrahydrofolate--homocysteine methyltransferase